MDISFPHTSKSTAVINKYEPMVASNFNCYIILYGELKLKLASDYTDLSEYIKSVTGLYVEKGGGTIEAGYKTTKFKYDSNEKETFYEIEIAFHNFLNNKSQAFILNKLLALHRVKYNPLSGTKGLKSLYAQCMIVGEKYDRNNKLMWRRTAHNAFIDEMADDMKGDYNEHDMQEITVKFNADYVSDITNDPLLLIV